MSARHLRQDVGGENEICDTGSKIRHISLCSITQFIQFWDEYHIKEYQGVGVRRIERTCSGRFRGKYLLHTSFLFMVQIFNLKQYLFNR